VTEQDHFFPAGHLVVPNMHAASSICEWALPSTLGSTALVSGVASAFHTKNPATSTAAVAQRTSFRLFMDASLVGRRILAQLVPFFALPFWESEGKVNLLYA
jgi:hypothetical protein